MRFSEILWLIALAVFLVWLETSPAMSAGCIMSYCQDGATTRMKITNTHRQVQGDLYWPGPGQRVQIRDAHRRIIGYIEADGTVTNTNRQKTGAINGR